MSVKVRNLKFTCMKCRKRTILKEVVLASKHGPLPILCNSCVWKSRKPILLLGVKQ